MNVVTRGIRNAFRNITRTISIVIILGLSIGLSLVMLIAHQAVENKIKTTLSSIGNTISVAPAGYMTGSAANNTLTAAQLAKVKKIAHVSKLEESFRDHLQTEGTTSMPTPPAGGASISSGGSDNGNATTSVKSSVKLNTDGNTKGGGGLTIVGGGSLPSNFSLPVSIVGTNYPTDPGAVGATTLKVKSGKAIDGTKDIDSAMISDAMAKKNSLKVGSTFTAYSKTLKVAAIFDTDSDSADGTIVVSLPTEQRLADQKDAITNAVVTVDSLDNLKSTTSAVKKSLGSSADVTSNVEQANNALKPLESVKSISLYSLIGAVAAGAVIILLTMIMIVRERRREIGILKAIGGSNIRIMAQFMCEALTLTILGAIIGLAIGLVGGNPVTSALVSNSDNTSGGGSGNGVRMMTENHDVAASVQNIQAQVGWTIILYGLGAAILIALIGSALASIFISKVRPAEVLRSE